MGWIDRTLDLYLLVDLMSTIWYGLREPVTSIRVDPRPGSEGIGDHAMFDLFIWVNHEQAGRIIVKLTELKGTIDLFLNKNRGIVYQNNMGEGHVQTSWIGPEEYYGQVISEYYEQNMVHRDDYDMERATHLWEPRSLKDKYVGGRRQPVPWRPGQG